MKILLSVATLIALAACCQAATAETMAPPLNMAAKQEIIVKVSAALTANYIFPDKAEAAKARIESSLKSREYNSIGDQGAFAKRLTDDLQSVTHDRHMRVFYTGISKVSAFSNAAPRPAPSSEGFASVQQLKGNIGYIDLAYFPKPPFFSTAANSAMRSLRSTSALIVDMRNNSGGSPESDSYFASFFFNPAKRTQLNSIIWRTPSTNNFTTNEFWTTPVSFPYLNKPVYILTSKKTFSGGEAFIYDLKVNKRATIYGETTGGGANPGSTFPLGSQFEIFIPTGRAENPLTHTNWDGAGISPDHLTGEKKAFQAAMTDAVDHLLKRKPHDRTLTVLRGELRGKADPSFFIKTNFVTARTTPSPGTEASLRRYIESLEKGRANYDEMVPALADNVRHQLPAILAEIKRLGALRSISFHGVSETDMDIYYVDFDYGRVAWEITPLTENGKVVGRAFQPVPCTFCLQRPVKF